MVEAPGRRDPLTTAAPALDAEEAAQIAENRFGIRGRLSPLRSERDQNFRVDAQGASYVMKIANPADGRSVVDLQTAAMRHIAETSPGLPVMRIVPAVDGADWAEVPTRDAGTLLVRLFTFMPGRMMSAAELDDAALRRFGATVARMGLALRGFFHPAAGYEILWDLKHTPRLRAIVHAIPDSRRRALVERTLDRFEDRVAPLLRGLRAQVVHNDLTIDNVLLDERARISAIVDFGDVTHTALVCDLAIALASLMWEQTDPFAPAAAALGGYAEVVPLEEAELGILGDLISARVAAWGAIAAWRSALFPGNADYITAGDDLAWDLLGRLDVLGPDRVAERLRGSVTAGSMPYRPVGTAELVARRRRVLGRSPLSYERPLHLVRGEGVWMFDADGRRYLDAYNNVPVVGHSHPRVAEAISRQSRALNTNTRYLHEAAVELAERLVETMPLDSVLFVNSGSEANDLAWRLARHATAHEGGIVSEYAYHGITEATTAFSPEEWPVGTRYRHVALIPAPDGYRGPYRRNEERWAERYAGHVGAAVEELGGRGFALAAAFVDPAFTSDGILVPPAAYLRELAAGVKASGGLLVADEVQAGHGRYGTGLWSFDASGVEPDLVTLGKPMGNGHPVAAIVTRSEIIEALPSEIEPFSTFGGNPVSCSAALAVLDVIGDERLVERALDTGSYLRDRLTELAAAHELIGDVRGQGLMIGVDLVRDRATREPAGREARAVMNAMRDRGVLVGSTGPAGNVLKIRPPLPFGREHADLLIAALDESLSATPAGS